MPNLPAFLRSKMVATDKCTKCLFDLSFKARALKTTSLGIPHLIPWSAPLTQENPDFIKKSGYLPGGGALTQEGG